MNQINGGLEESIQEVKEIDIVDAEVTISQERKRG